MFEALAVYSHLLPWATALLLLPCGLVAGSFCTVLRHRLPLGKSIVAPRSHCPNCLHTLGPLDLLPVVSYLWLRGRCRYCSEEIPFRYLAIEMLHAVAGMAAGAALGLQAGLGALLLAILATAGWAGLQGLRLRRQAGFSLVEVLVAAFMLTLVLSAVFDAINMTRQSTQVAERRTQAVGLARECLAEVAGIAWETQTPADPNCALGDLQAEVTIEGRENNSYWHVTVHVSCPTCPASLARASQVRLEGMVTP
jgi:Tfp pilus assembly protein PilV